MTEAERVKLLAKARAAFATLGEIVGALEAADPEHIDPAEAWAADLLVALAGVFGSRPFTTAHVLGAIEHAEGAELAEVLLKPRDRWSPGALGKRLGEQLNRNLRGLTLESAGMESGSRVWAVKAWGCLETNP